MSKVIEEAKRYIKEKDALLLHTVEHIENLITELGSKNKEVERYKAVVNATIEKYPHDAHCDINDLHAALFPETKKPCNCWIKALSQLKDER